MRDKISITRFILEKIDEANELTLEAMFPRGRAESKIWRQILSLPENYEFSSHTFSTILSRLKKQGLVISKGGRRKTIWRTSAKGKEKLKFNNSIKLEPPQSDGIPRLVVYDIPEPEKQKREWLRGALISCGYNQLQRSVWLGHHPLPEKLIKQIYDYGLKDKIHIVSIKELGTLE